ncbi:ABC transporter permease [Candidatus Zixiibacteriota bacterium]
MALSDLRDDVVYAGRTMRRNIGFFLVAVAIIGIGIGANTAVFSVVNTLLYRPLPFREPERLVRVANIGTQGGLSSATLRSSNLRDWRAMNQSFEEMTGYFAFFDYISYILSGEGDPKHVTGVAVVRDFLEVLDIPLQLGRNFAEEEAQDFNVVSAVILTHDFWQRQYSGDPGIVGRSITINESPASVVGVLPDWFDYGSVFTPGTRVDFLTPFPVNDQTDGWGNTIFVIGRLKPGVSITAAQAELDAINTQLREADPQRWGVNALTTDLTEEITGRFRTSMLVLACAVALVLLITCVNLSNMLLARASSRRREIAVRSALGADRSRLMRQMLTESLILSGSGALLGIILAYAVTSIVAGTQAISIPLLASVSVDGTALLFTLIAAIATGLLFGIVPALQMSGIAGHNALGDSSRGASQSRGRRWVRETLVVSEIALACLLLVGTGLLLRSFVTLMGVDLGFEPENAAAWRIETNMQFDSAADWRAYIQRLIDETEAIPGVESAGLTDTLPLGRNRAWGVRAEGQVYGPGEQPVAFPRIVDSGYIGTMQIPLISGRDFTIHDTAETDPVVIINENMARRLWPDGNAIGQNILLRGPLRVVGVVSNVRHSSLEEDSGLEMYLPIMQQGGNGFALDLVVRSEQPLASLAPRISATLRSLDPTLPTGDFRPLEEIVNLAVSPRRFILMLISTFAMIALFLASLGIYGVVAYSVSQQTREIGIRIALGATATRVQLLVLSRTVMLALAGIVTGLIGSILLSKLIASMLYGISPTDPVTLAVMVSLLALISIVAGLLPAVRASRIDPISVMNAG